MAQHIITGSGAPTIRPEHPGQHYIDESADPRVTYIGLSTDDQTPVAGCWQEVGSGGDSPSDVYNISASSPSIVLDQDSSKTILVVGDGSNVTVDVSALVTATPDTSLHGGWVVVVTNTPAVQFLNLPVEGYVIQHNGGVVFGDLFDLDAFSDGLLRINIVAGTPFIEASATGKTLVAGGAGP